MPKYTKKTKKIKIKASCALCKKTKNIAHWFYRGTVCGNCVVNLGYKKPGTGLGRPAALKTKRCYFCHRKREQYKWARGPQCELCITSFGLREKKQFVPLHNKYRNKKNCAVERGHKWLITPNQFYALIKNPCFYCGSIEPDGTSGLDRIDSLGDYVPGNIVPSCRTCNLVKHLMSLKKFGSWVKQAHSHGFWNKLNELDKFKQVAE